MLLVKAENLYTTLLDPVFKYGKMLLTAVGLVL